MYSGKTTSVQEILWKVLRNPLCQDLTIEQASEYVVEVLKLIGAPLSFSDKVEELELKHHKVSLPADLIEIKGVKHGGIPLRYGTDLYHVDVENECISEYTYIVQECVLISSLDKGCLTISYKALPTDKDGFPLIPDNESYRMAIEYYIMHRYLELIWAMSKITDKVFQYYEQKRHWYVGQASSSLTAANKDQLESMVNSINRLIINNDAYSSFYRNMGTPERIKRYY